MRERNRRRMILAASVAALGAVNLNAGATQYLYDGFDYTAGDRLGGSGTNPLGQIAPNGEQWITRSPAGGGSWTATRDTLIEAGNLSYPGLAPSYGASARYGDTASTNKYTDAIRLPGAMSINSGSVYYSAIVRFHGQIPLTPVSGVRTSYASFSTETANPATDAGLGVGTSTGVSNVPLPASAWLRNSGTTDFHFGSGKQNGDGLGTSASAPSWQSATAFPNQQGNTAGTGQQWATIDTNSYFVVLKYTFNGASSSDDTVSMWINPVATTLGQNTGEAAAGSAGGSYYSATNAFTTANIDASQIQSFMLIGLAQSSASTTKTVDTSLDELRIGTTWADVTTAGLIWDGDAAGGTNPSDTSGTWDAASNNWWDTTTNRTWGSSYVAVFGTGAGAGPNVAVNVSGAQTAGKIVFAASSPIYALNGGSIILGGADGEGIVANQSATVSSDITIAANQRWTVATGATLAAGKVSGAANLTKFGPGTLTATHVRTNGLTVSGGTVQINQNGTANAVSVVNTIALAPGAKLDLKDNDLIVHTTPTGTWNGTDYDGVTGLVKAGRGATGAWDGSGIVTSMPDAVGATKKTTLAVASAADALHLTGSATALWGGQVVSATDTLVKYTYNGDADLNGKVNADDYFAIDSNYSKSGTVFGFAKGDFNYDGVINGDDFLLIDAGFSAQGAPLAMPLGGLAAVPEPTAISLLALSAAGLLRRARRRA